MNFRPRMAFLALGLAACVTTTPEGDAVRVTTNPEAVRGCVFIGNVEGRESGWGGVGGQNIAEANAHKLLRENAALGGADTVLLMTSNVGFSGAVQRGEAYRCRQAPSLTSATRPAAAAAVPANTPSISFWEIVASRRDVAVLQAPYDFAAPVLIQGRPWILREGQRLLVTGLIGDAYSKFFQVADGPRLGYVQQSSVVLYRNGYQAGLDVAATALQRLAATMWSKRRQAVGDRTFAIFGLFPGQANSADGIDAVAAYRLLGSTSAKYITLTATAFNAVGDQVSDSVTGEATKVLQITGPIEPRPMSEPGNDDVSSWRAVWYNPTIKCLQLDSVELEYLDGSRERYAGPNLAAILYPELDNSCSIRQ